MEQSTINIKRLLARGSVSTIAKKLGISSAAVSQALTEGKPGNKSVQEALRMAEASGALATAQKLATITTAV